MSAGPLATVGLPLSVDSPPAVGLPLSVRVAPVAPPGPPASPCPFRVSLSRVPFAVIRSAVIRSSVIQKTVRTTRRTASAYNLPPGRAVHIRARRRTPRRDPFLVPVRHAAGPFPRGMQ